MEVKRLRTLPLEAFKTLNNMNPEHIKEIFHKTAFTTHRPLNLEVNETHTTKYGNKSQDVWVLIFGTPLQIKLKKKPTTLSSRNLLTIGLT